MVTRHALLSVNEKCLNFTATQLYGRGLLVTDTHIPVENRREKLCSLIFFMRSHFCCKARGIPALCHLRYVRKVRTWERIARWCILSIAWCIMRILFPRSCIRLCAAIKMEMVDSKAYLRMDRQESEVCIYWVSILRQ